MTTSLLIFQRNRHQNLLQVTNLLFWSLSREYELFDQFFTEKKEGKKDGSSESDSGTEGGSEDFDESESEADRESQLLKLEAQLKKVSEKLHALQGQGGRSVPKPKKKKETTDSEFKASVKPPKAKGKKPTQSRRYLAMLFLQNCFLMQDL